MKYTYAGDANLDGSVNSLDFNALATNFGTSDNLWFNGDFNYDGTVNSLDFNALATNFGGTNDFWNQGDFNYDGLVNSLDFNFIAANFNATALPGAALPSTPALGTLVPEPATLALATLGAALVMRRKRRG